MFIRHAAGIAVAFVTMLCLFAGTADATSQADALRWLEGRWAHTSCSEWIEFTRRGSGWIYAEARFDQGRPTPAKVSANAAGLVSVLMSGDDYTFSLKATFSGKDSFVSNECS
jgi:hypothetical protein